MKHLKGIFVLFSSLVLFSCATTQTSKTNEPTLVIRGEEQNPGKLQKNQLLSVTNRIENPVYMQTTNWSKVRVFSDLLDEFKGHKDFTNDEKFDLLSFVFDDLPINGKDGVTREVYIGKYFFNGDPLILRIGVLTPKNEAALKNEKVIVIMSNVVRLIDGSLNKKMGGFINLDSNAAIFCGLNKGLLTNGQRTEDKTKKIDVQTLTAMDRVMVSQNYLADENIANDSIAHDLVSKNIDNPAEQPAIVIMSMLIKYDYFLSIEDVASADSLWKNILEYSKKVPGDMNPESLESLNGESLYLMKRLLSTNVSI